MEGGDGGRDMKRKCHGSITENKHNFHFMGKKAKRELCLEQLLCTGACLCRPPRVPVLLWVAETQTGRVARAAPPGRYGTGHPHRDGTGVAGGSSLRCSFRARSTYQPGINFAQNHAQEHGAVCHMWHRRPASLFPGLLHTRSKKYVTCTIII